MTMGTQTAILRGNPVGLVAILDSVFTILSLVSTLINVEKLPSLSCHYIEKETKLAKTMLPS